MKIHCEKLVWAEWLECFCSMSNCMFKITLFHLFFISVELIWFFYWIILLKILSKQMQMIYLCSFDEVISLLSCSGIMRPGLNAILGPTGSGKSSWVSPWLLGIKKKCFLVNHLHFLCLLNICFLFSRFLDILAARKDPSGVSGEVLVDRAPQPPNFKCLSGYVVQVSEMNDWQSDGYVRITHWSLDQSTQIICFIYGMQSACFVFLPAAPECNID